MKKSSPFFLTIILAIIFGFLAGLAGFIILSVNSFKLPLIGQVLFTDFGGNRQVVIDQPRNVVIKQDEQISQIENSLLPALLNIYHPLSGATALLQAYATDDILGQGFTLTADGWFVAPVQAVANLKDKYTIIGYQNKKYLADKFVADKTMGVVFGKFDASNLPVAKIGKSRDLTTGQTVVLISERTKIEITHIKKIGYDFPTANSLILNSDRPQKEIFLDLPLTSNHNGAVLADLKGEIIGLVAGGKVIPVDYFSNIVPQILNSQTISRPALGVSYLDLAQVEGLIDKGDKGALVVAEPLKSSAAFGQVKNGDIIKKVNDSELNVYRGLAEVINDYKTGDTVELTIKRQDQDLSVKVVLK
ncbi:MAG: PDZ domain-containing protein [bacterium]